ncbi:MAG: glycoside hydrolase family 1 protein [Thermoprotei archaeon]|nr:MAG: glycoside hydrolase family 1 protein [Thermoprotei archaeon]
MFPKDFLWGVSMSGFQFEMGDPKGRNVDPNTDWFKWVHDEENIRNGIVSGDLPEHGVNYWELYSEDHERARGMGMNAYRLNIEWSRVFPRPTYGVEAGVEEEGGIAVSLDIAVEDLEKLDEIADKAAVEHYRSIIQDLRERGFKVILNLVHFTLPLWLHDPITARRTKLRRGPLGWLSPQFKEEFAKFAAYTAWKFGDLVDSWSTFNEPSIVAVMGYLFEESHFPPGVKNLKAYRRAMLNIAQAHVLAYWALKKFDTVRADRGTSSPAEVGIIHDIIIFQPLNPDKKTDVKATNYLNLIFNEWILRALSRGWLDRNFNDRLDEGEEYPQYRGKIDWIGVNYYSRMVVKGKWIPFGPVPAIPEVVPGYGFACEKNSVSRDGRPTSDFGWELYPEGIRDAVLLAAEYASPILITENGIADSEDKLRPRFIVEHLKVLEELVEERKVDLRGYLHWALTDNYEWAEGFRMKFGLYAVDLATKRRVKRRSVDVMAEIIEEGCVSEELLKRYAP